LHAYGVSRIYSPEDGQRMGLQGMIGEMVMRCDKDITALAPTDLSRHPGPHRGQLARTGPVAHRYRSFELQSGAGTGNTCASSYEKDSN